MFEVASHQRVIGLQRDKAGPVFLLRQDQCLHQMPRRPVRAADVTHLALPHQVVKGAHRLFHRRQNVPTVDLIEIDIVHAESSQTMLYRREDVLARQADVIQVICAGSGPLAHCAADLRGDNDFVARDAGVFQSLAENRFRLSVRIDVGCIEEINARC